LWSEIIKERKCTKGSIPLHYDVIRICDNKTYRSPARFWRLRLSRLITVNELGQAGVRRREKKREEGERRKKSERVRISSSFAVDLSYLLQL
jgi:hypothetical protein